MYIFSKKSYLKKKFITLFLLLEIFIFNRIISVGFCWTVFSSSSFTRAHHENVQSVWVVYRKKNCPRRTSLHDTICRCVSPYNARQSSLLHCTICTTIRYFLNAFYKIFFKSTDTASAHNKTSNYIFTYVVCTDKHNKRAILFILFRFATLLLSVVARQQEVRRDRDPFQGALTFNLNKSELFFSKMRDNVARVYRNIIAQVITDKHNFCRQRKICINRLFLLYPCR